MRVAAEAFTTRSMPELGSLTVYSITRPNLPCAFGFILLELKIRVLPLPSNSIEDTNLDFLET